MGSSFRRLQARPSSDTWRSSEYLETRDRCRGGRNLPPLPSAVGGESRSTCAPPCSSNHAPVAPGERMRCGQRRWRPGRRRKTMSHRAAKIRHFGGDEHTCGHIVRPLHGLGRKTRRCARLLKLAPVSAPLRMSSTTGASWRARGPSHAANRADDLPGQDAVGSPRTSFVHDHGAQQARGTNVFGEGAKGAVERASSRRERADDASAKEAGCQSDVAPLFL